MTISPHTAGRRLNLAAKVSAEEWQQRVDLAACFRLMAHYEMADLTFTHVSARVPGEPDCFLINPFHVMFEEVTASSLVKIGLDGKVRHDTPYQVNPAGFTIHSAVQAARPDAVCALHTHSTAGIAVSSLECGLLPMSQTALRFHGNLAYHDYEGVAIDHDERPRLARDLGDKGAMVLRNHGLLTVGRSVAEAFVLMHRPEFACRAQLQAQATGTKLVALSDNTLNHAAQQFKSLMPGIYGDLEWPSLLRLCDRLDPSYKD